MLGSYGVAAYGAAKGAGALGLEVSGVQGGEGFEVGLQGGREHVIGCILRGPDSVASRARGWGGEEFERGVGWRLGFVGHLGGLAGWFDGKGDWMGWRERCTSECQ